ncbi:MAG: prenyltransferase/squalene oxidase repeat-containing protein [Pirellulales bacterium]
MIVRCLALLAVVLFHPSTMAARGDEPVPAEAAAGPDVARSLALLAASAEEYTRQRDCFSCHHQTLPVMALALAGAHGLETDSAAARAQSEFTIRHFADRKESLVKGEGVPGGPFSAGYALVGLAADNWPADETTAALVAYLTKRQQDDGSWKIGTHRPPLEDSDFAATALSLRGLDLYAPADGRDGAAERIAKARTWLLGQTAVTNEDMTFRLLGLKWAAAAEEEIQSAAAQLLAAQRDDGGWGQLSEMASDAYATGQALTALAQAGGIGADHAAYRNAVAWLLESQLADGSWLVTTRIRPIQVYFESGFPHEKSQFISISATSWATMALILSEGANP